MVTYNICHPEDPEGAIYDTLRILRVHIWDLEDPQVATYVPEAAIYGTLRILRLPYMTL